MDQLTKLFLERTKDISNVFSIEEALEFLPEIKDKFISVSKEILKTAKFTTPMIEDVFSWQNEGIEQILTDIVELYPADYIIKSCLIKVKGEDKLVFYKFNKDKQLFAECGLNTKWMPIIESEFFKSIEYYFHIKYNGTGFVPSGTLFFTEEFDGEK